MVNPVTTPFNKNYLPGGDVRFEKLAISQVTPGTATQITTFGEHGLFNYSVVTIFNNGTVPPINFVDYSPTVIDNKNFTIPFDTTNYTTLCSDGFLVKKSSLVGLPREKQDYKEVGLPITVATDRNLVQTAMPIAVSKNTMGIQSEVDLSMLGIPRHEIQSTVMEDVTRYGFDGTVWTTRSDSAFRGTQGWWKSDYYSNSDTGQKYQDFTGYGINFLKDSSCIQLYCNTAPESAPQIDYRQADYPGLLPNGECYNLLQTQRTFKYLPGRTNVFTFGVRAIVDNLSSIPDQAYNDSYNGQFPLTPPSGNIARWGVGNNTDAYYFELSGNGQNSDTGTPQVVFSINRRRYYKQSVSPSNFNWYNQYTNALVSNSIGNYYPDEPFYSLNLETTNDPTADINEFTRIFQKDFSQDTVDGKGKSGAILNFDKVTMFKIEFSWYGAIGARFFAYLPVNNQEAKWILLHEITSSNEYPYPALQNPVMQIKYLTKARSGGNVQLFKYGVSAYIEGGTYGTTNQKTYYNVDTKIVGGASIPLLGISTQPYVQNSFNESIPNQKITYPTKVSLFSTQDTIVDMVIKPTGTLIHGITKGPILTGIGLQNPSISSVILQDTDYKILSGQWSKYVKNGDPANVVDFIGARIYEDPTNNIINYAGYRPQSGVFGTYVSAVSTYSSTNDLLILTRSLTGNPTGVFNYFTPNSYKAFQVQPPPPIVGYNATWIGVGSATGSLYERHVVKNLTWSSGSQQLTWSQYKTNANLLTGAYTNGTITNASSGIFQERILSDGSLLLTRSAQGQSGNSYFLDPIRFLDDQGKLIDWTVTATFSMPSTGTLPSFGTTPVLPAEPTIPTFTSRADGMGIILQSNTTDYGGAGGGMGYSGIPNSVGIFFDTYNNGGYDPNNNHVEINVNGSTASKAISVPPGYQGTTSNVISLGVQVSANLVDTNKRDLDLVGASTVGATDGTGVNRYLWVSYTASLCSMKVFVSNTNTKPLTANLDYKIDLRHYIKTKAVPGNLQGQSLTGTFVPFRFEQLDRQAVSKEVFVGNDTYYIDGSMDDSPFDANLNALSASNGVTFGQYFLRNYVTLLSCAQLSSIGGRGRTAITTKLPHLLNRGDFFEYSINAPAPVQIQPALITTGTITTWVDNVITPYTFVVNNDDRTITRPLSSAIFTSMSGQDIQYTAYIGLTSVPNPVPNSNLHAIGYSYNRADSSLNRGSFPDYGLPIDRIKNNNPNPSDFGIIPSFLSLTNYPRNYIPGVTPLSAYAEYYTSLPRFWSLGRPFFVTNLPSDRTINDPFVLVTNTSLINRGIKDFTVITDLFDPVQQKSTSVTWIATSSVKIGNPNTTVGRPGISAILPEGFVEGAQPANFVRLYPDTSSSIDYQSSLPFYSLADFIDPKLTQQYSYNPVPSNCFPKTITSFYIGANQTIDIDISSYFGQVKEFVSNAFVNPELTPWNALYFIGRTTKPNTRAEVNIGVSWNEQ